MEDLVELARLLDERNRIDSEIARIVGRSARIGDVGEYIAARVFEIKLHDSGSAKGSDGIFMGGPFKGRTVNVKFYTDSGTGLTSNRQAARSSTWSSSPGSSSRTRSSRRSPASGSATTAS